MSDISEAIETNLEKMVFNSQGMINILNSKFKKESFEKIFLDVEVKNLQLFPF